MKTGKEMAFGKAGTLKKFWLAKENILKERKLISGFGIKTEKTRVGKKIIITESWTENLTTYHHTQK